MNMGKDGDKEGRGPRDIIIFDRNKTILKNDYLELDNKEVSIFFTIDNNQESVIEIDNRYYLAYRKNMGDLTLFLTRDLTQLIEFHEWLILLAAIGSIIGLFIIYFLSIHLAKLMLTPIREHNTALESYSHNVAHELKTPLAVMRSNMELLKLSKSESLIDSTNEEVISMERIIDTLLLMANPKKHFHTSERIDIIALTQSIIDGYEDESIEIRGEKNKKMIE
jgi:signal transduction histidine kinase